MPLPAELSTVTITGLYQHPNGTAMRGWVTLTPNPGKIVAADSGVTIQGPVTAELVDGSFTLTVIATDSDGINPTGWTYNVTLSFYDTANDTFDISLPKNAPTVSLNAITPASEDDEGTYLIVTGPQGVPGQIQSVNGQQGPDVILDAADVAALPSAGGTLTGPLALPIGGTTLTASEAMFTGLSTGVTFGGVLSVSLGTPGAIDITETVGYITDVATSPGNPTLVRVHSPARTVALDAASLARGTTWWLLDAAGSVVQQEPRPSGAQMRTHIVLGFSAQDGPTILALESLPILLQQPMNQMADLLDALGPFVISGAQVTAAGANLSLNLSAGLLFARSFNHAPPGGGPVTDNPNLAPVVAETPVQWRYITRSTFTPALTSQVDPTQYDNNGVLTPVTGGAGSATIQRLWLFPSGQATNQLGIQYGQSVYSSLSAAVDGIGGRSFVQHPQTFGATALIGHLVVTRTATNLSDPTQAVIVRAGKFAAP